MADDLSFPFGVAATFEGDAVDVVGIMGDVSVADFAVGVREVLVDNSFGTPFPLA